MTGRWERWRRPLGWFSVAKLGAPDRDVACATGDGAAGFNVMELQTAAREGIDITVIVCAGG